MHTRGCEVHTEQLTVDILHWLCDPPADRAIHFSDGRGGWSSTSYAALAAKVRQVAWQLTEAGVGRGDVVLIIGPNSTEFIAMFYGALYVGATPATIPPPTLFSGLGEYSRRLANTLAALEPAVILASSDIAAMEEVIATCHGRQILTETKPGAPMAQAYPDMGDTGLIQFSSGSSGTPRGVRVSRHALNTNVTAMGQWLRGRPADRGVSWVPFYHDMGLVGCLLLPFAVTASLWYLRPEEFIRSPLLWLRTISAIGGTSCAVPAFSLSHILRRVRPADLDGVDLSSLRTLVIGAERVAPATLDDFYQLLKPFGLSRGALLPAYGLAEATLAVTGIRAPGSEIPTRLINPSALAVAEPIQCPAAPSDPAVEVISCGRPISGVAVAIVGAGGQPLPEGSFGEISVRGDSVATGYLDGEQPFDGVLRTGDMGFMLDGELYVVGRVGDSIKRNGRWIFAEDVEQIAIAASSQRHHTVALLGTVNGQDCAVIVLAGRRAESQASDVGRAVASRMPGLRVLVVQAAQSRIKRTTSGKPRRRAMWRELMTGASPAQFAWDSAAAEQSRVLATTSP
jgi:acyl-CoA synthetase (AMP-forming)/AMP-acid ligase II